MICGGLALRFLRWMSTDLDNFFISNKQYLKLASATTNALKK